ncbi:MAG: hypothetical protein KC668_22280 [Myxococcales bacterium]|nr:hypothetical protein [Myxococcales bacterium]
MKRFFDDGRRVTSRALACLAVPLCLALVVSGVVAQASEDDLRALFPKVADIDTQGADGLVRAPLPAEVLAAVRADLADVRVFVAGRSVEFVIEADPPRTPSTTWPLAPLDVREQVMGDRAQPQVVETWDVQLPGDAPVTTDDEPLAWRLAFGMAPGELVRELSIHRVDEAGAESPLADTTLFRMQGPLREKLSVRVEPLPGARLRLRLRGPAPAQRPTVTLHTESSPTNPRELSVPLEVLASERSADQQETVLTVQRPRGVVPDALVFATSSGAFHREVVVEDTGVGARGAEIGRAVVYNIPSWHEALLSLPISAATGDQLRVRVLDGDAPPLSELRVTARVRQPALVFETYGSQAQLYFGGARATRPAYGLRELQGRFTPGAAVSEARVRPATDNTRFHAGPVLAFAMRPGAPVDTAGFSHTRAVHVPETPEGLVRVPLDVETLAQARTGADDVRVVDREGRQWPYLWGDEPEPRAMEVTLTATPRPAERATTFRLELPGVVRVEEVLLDVEAALVSRRVEVWGSDSLEGEPYLLETSTIERGPSTRDPQLRVSVGATVRALELRVRDGDEQPLSVQRASVVVQVRDLFMAAPAGDYQLLVGNALIDSPSYDLESARELVLSLRAASAELGPLEANPGYAPPSPSRDAVTETALLVVLVVVVLLLGALTFRLVRSDGDGPAPASSGAVNDPAPGDAGDRHDPAPAGDAGDTQRTEEHVASEGASETSEPDAEARESRPVVDAVAPERDKLPE